MLQHGSRAPLQRGRADFTTQQPRGAATDAGPRASSSAHLLCKPTRAETPPGPRISPRFPVPVPAAPRRGAAGTMCARRCLCSLGRAQPRRFPFLPHLSSSTAPMIKAANPPRLTPCCRGSGDPAAAPWPPERFGCAPERPRIARGSARGVRFNLWDFGANWGSFSAWQKVWGRGAASLA